MDNVFLSDLKKQKTFANLHESYDNVLLGTIATYNWVFPPFWYELAKQLQGFETVIELGSGKESPFRFCSKPSYSVGVDIFKPYIQESRSRQIHDDYVLGDITKIHFVPKCVDVVMCLSVLEHLPKEDGIALLEQMEKWAKHKSIIYVPNGEWGQEAYDGNPHQEHISTWNATELRQYGYSIFPVGGIKSIAEIMTSAPMQRYRGHICHTILYKLLRDFSQRIIGKRIDECVDILCVKNLKQFDRR